MPQISVRFQPGVASAAQGRLPGPIEGSVVDGSQRVQWRHPRSSYESYAWQGHLRVIDVTRIADLNGRSQDGSSSCNCLFVCWPLLPPVVLAVINHVQSI